MISAERDRYFQGYDDAIDCFRAKVVGDFKTLEEYEQYRQGYDARVQTSAPIWYVC